MSRVKIFIVSSILIALDVGVTYGVFRFALILRKVLAPFLGKSPVPWDHAVPVAELGIFLILGMFLLLGLYPGYGLTAIKELEQMGKAVTLAFVLLATISYLNKPFQEFPRSIFPIAWSLSIFALPVMRFATRNFLCRTQIYGVPVTIFGEGQWADKVVQSLLRMRRIGWRPTEQYPHERITLQEKYKSSEIAIIASTPDVLIAGLVRVLNQHFRTVVLIQKTEHLGSLCVETRDLDRYLGLEFHFHLLTRRNRWLKKVTDLIGSILLLILLGPFLLFLSILIAIDSPGPVLFSQERMGKEFRRFDLLKFRTMVVGAEGKLQQLLEEDSTLKAQYVEFHKLSNDPRVTRVGRILRKFSLDELPQLWNVLKGEMSLSGPRAYMPAELDKMGYYAPTIFRVDPGMTGLWQVLGRSNTSFQKRLEMDEYYISNWSLWMDIYILMKTLGVVVGGTGT